MMTLSQTELLNIYHHLHQIPELGLEEFETHDFLLEQIQRFSQARLTIKLVPQLPTAILVKVSGKQHHSLIGYRTDLDALPVTEKTGSEYQSTHTGKMHACGHDVHMTVALGILSYFADNQPATDLLFIFQPSEENHSGGKQLYETGVLAGEWLPTELYGLHDNPQLAAGTIGCRQGTLFAGTCEIHITMHGKSGHAAYPYLANDMVVAASQLIGQLQTVVSRDVDAVEGGVVTIGHLSAGRTGNVIAGQAQIDGTIRALTQVNNRMMQQRVKTICEGVALSFGCQVDVRLSQGGYLPVENDPETTTALINYFKADEQTTFVETLPAMTGEDFGFLLSKIRGTMFWLGVNSPYQLHSEQMLPDQSAIITGVKSITGFIQARAVQIK